jgi:outer membrane autotransporter protein
MSTRRLPSTLVALALVAAPAGAYNLVMTPQAPSVGEFRNTLTVTVALSGCNSPANQVTWDAFTVALDPIEATPGADFGGPTPKSFPVGNGALTASIVIPIFQDTLDEPNESFDLLLRPRSVQTLNCSNGALNPVLSEYRARVTILDDDGTVGISIGDATVTEGDSGTRLATFRIAAANLEAASAGVAYQTRNGSATAPADYRATKGQVTLTPDAPAADVTVVINGDTAVEGDENFFVDLSNPAGGAIVDGRGRGTIRDDDGEQPLPIASLQAVGTLERVAGAGAAVELAVRALFADGRPAAGVPVDWAVTGDAALQGGSTSVTNGDGVASKSATLGGRTPTASVVATAGDLAGVTFVLRLQSDLGSLFDPGDDPGLASVAGVLDGLCAESSNRYASLCRYLGDITPDDARRAIEELAPTEALAQSDVAVESARAGLRTIQERQRQLRRAARRGRAGGGVALDLGLPSVTRAGGSSLPFVVGPGGEPAIRGPRLADEGFDAEVAAALAADVDAALADGGGRAAPQEPSSSSEAGAEEKRGGFFLSGRLTKGDRDATSRDAGLDYDAAGGTLGVDYRTGARLFLGLAGGYADSGADFTGGGDLSLKGENLTAYLTYAGDAFFFDLVAGFGRDAYKLKRDLSLPTGGGGVQLVHGVGEPDGDERLAEMGLGWDISAGAGTWTISGRASYVGVSIDRFVETLSAGGVELEIFDQDVESLLAEASIEWTYAASFGWGVLQPQLSAAARHEFEDDAHELRGRFVGDPAGGIFTMPSEPVDATFFAARGGVTAVFPGGFAVYGNLEQEFGRDGLSVATASAGLRFEW